MDSKALSDLLECSVCLEVLDATSKVLPCQHTFCRRCLEEIQQSHGELRCPECRVLVDTNIEELPANILLIRILEGLKTSEVVKSIGTSKTHARQTVIPSSGGVQAHSSLSFTSHGDSITATSRTNASTSGYRPWIHTSPKLGISATQVSPSHRPLPNKPILTPHPCAKAMYQYDAKEHGDLSFKVGDIITLRKQIDDNWYVGELNGKNGFLPASYIQVITPLPTNIPNARALYDFEVTDQNDKDCLTFKKDSIIHVIRRVDENWAEGRQGDHIGIFPISFVEMNNAAKSLIKFSSGKPGPSRVVPKTPSTSDTSESEGNPPTPTHTNCISQQSQLPRLQSREVVNKRHSISALHTSPSRVPPQSHRHSLEMPNFDPLQACPTSSVAHTPFSNESVTVPSTSHAETTSATTVTMGMGSASAVSKLQVPVGKRMIHPVLFVAMYAYKPMKSDELELRKGDSYSVTEMCQDGWYKGSCLRTGRTGVFPGNYVQPSDLSTSLQLTKSSATVPGRTRLTPSHPRHSTTSATSSAGIAGAEPNIVRTSMRSGGTVASGHQRPNIKASIAVPTSCQTVSSIPNVSLCPVTTSATSKQEKVKGKDQRTRTASGLVRLLTGGGKKRTVAGVTLPPPADVTHIVASSTDSRPRLNRSESTGSSSNSAASSPSRGDLQRGTSAPAGVPPSRGGPTPVQPTPLIRERFRCIVPYPPQTEYELELKIGDVVYVHKKREDGWYRGTLQRTGKTGLFPGSFVESF